MLTVGLVGSSSLRVIGGFRCPGMAVELGVDDLLVIGVAVKRVRARVHREKPAAGLNPLVEGFEIERDLAGGVEGDDLGGLEFLGREDRGVFGGFQLEEF